MKNLLTKADVMRHTELKKELVKIPEWGGSLWVQEMTSIQRDYFEAWTMEQPKGSVKGTRIAVILNTVVDEKGKPFFTDLDIPDLEVKPADIIDRIAAVGLRLSGMTEAAQENERKNSEPVQEEDLSSDSAEN